MKRSGLAARLIRASNNTERKRLIAAHPTIADDGLARELANQCYRVWASEPVIAQRAAAALRVLTQSSNDNETLALSHWANGIADITKGKLEAAIEDLDAASSLLRRLGREHESAQPQVAKLIALAMLGRYDQAKRAGDRALKIFTKYGDQLAAGKIEMNLSNIVSRRDQYRQAERYCMSAYRRFRMLGERTWQTMAENGLANTYAELSDFKGAEDFYSRALENARAAKMNVTVAEIEASLGNLALFRGRYAEALRWLELSRQKYEKLEMPHQTAIAELEIADIYSELNLAAEATEIYQSLIPKLRRLKLRAEEARARANFGRVMIAAGELRSASRELKQSARLFTAEKNFIAAAAVDIRNAEIELSQGKIAAADSTITASLKTLETSENARLRLAAMWMKGEILARDGRSRDAASLLADVRKEARRGEQPAIEQAATNSLGVLAVNEGRDREAESYFRAAIASAEAARDPLPGEEFRMAFQAKSLAAYENLRRLYLGRGDIAKAFETAERARSRTLLDAFTSKDRGVGDKQLVDAREELNFLYSRAARADDEDDSKLEREIRQLEKRLAAMTLRSKSAGRSRSAADVRQFDIAAFQKRLGPNRVLIEFAEDDDRFSAFVVTDALIEHVDLQTTSDEISSLLDGLHFQFGSLRFGGEAIHAFAPQLKARADVYLARLYDLLLRPLQMLIGDRCLVVVPAGVLNYVPFHALFDGQCYAIESREISYSPSAAVWQMLRAAKPRAVKKTLLMAYADERIPLVDREVAALARRLPDPTKLTGRAATFEAFGELAPKCDLIHLACHGQFRPDSPMFSSLHLADGWVTVRDITARRLKAQLVTLSACETGRSSVFAGEEILGLARGFLSAGARSLVLSLWTVNDEATARLMADFYDGLQRGLSTGASLRLAQRRFIDRGEHPYFWSPFFLIG